MEKNHPFYGKRMGTSFSEFPMLWEFDDKNRAFSMR